MKGKEGRMVCVGSGEGEDGWKEEEVVGGEEWIEEEGRR